MINTNLLNSTPIKKELEKSDFKNKSENGKEFLSDVLRKNLGINPQNSTHNLTNSNAIANFSTPIQNKLQKLINKLLDQLNSQKNTSNFKSSSLNFAPNFSKELKTLTTDLAKLKEFQPLREKLEQISKPIEQMQKKEMEGLLKNSGIFFEAKLKNALNSENFPKSFHALLNTIKTLSSEKISAQISELATKDLNATNSFKELKTLLENNKTQNLEILKNSAFQNLLKLSAKSENFIKYLTKNPELANEKIQHIAEQILKEVKIHEKGFYKELNKPENLLLTNTNTLKEVAQSFKNLISILKNILENPTNFKIPDKNLNENLNLNENKISQNINSKLDLDQNFSQKPNPQNPNLPNHNSDLNLQNTPQNPSQTLAQKNVPQNENLTLPSSTNQEIIDENSNSNQNENINLNKQELPKESIKNDSNEKFIDKNFKNDEKTNLQNLKNENEVKKDLNSKNILDKDLNFSKTENLTKEIQITQNKTLDNNLKQNAPIKENANSELLNHKNIKNTIKNLIFNDGKSSLVELENLSKNLGILNRKINESLKILDDGARNAKINLNDIKNIENKLELSIKDLAKVTPREKNEISNDIKNDVKSTLLQVSNLAKDLENNAILNQSNRLLAQIEINQLISLANNSINTFLPFFWDDLNDSQVVFKRGKKDKFFAQIKLDFTKLGKLDILLALNHEKYLDINIMVENSEFRKIIYQNAHELKRNIHKIGLLGSHFFVGDIIKSEFKTQKFKDYDFDIGIDTKA